MTMRIVRRLLMAGVVLAAGSRALVAQQSPVDLLNPDKGVGVPGFLEGDTIPDIFLSPSVGAVPTHVLNGSTGALMGAGAPFGGFGGGTRIGVGDLTGDGVPDIVAGMGPGGGLVTLLDGATLAGLGGGYPFGPAFGGGVSVAVGDVNGDGRNDIIAAQAAGGGTVSVFNGVNYAPLLSVAPFGGYGGGVNVATGDFDGDGRADIIAGQASGGVVSIINGATGAVVASGIPFGGVNGVFVAAGDVTGDGRAEAIVAPGSGGAPVLVFNIATLTVVNSIAPFPGTDSGVRVAASDLNGDGRPEILAVPGPGVAPVVRIYDGATFANTANYPFSGGFSAVGALVAVPTSAGLRFTSANAVRFATGTASSFTVRAAGTPAVTSITMTGTLPAGITFADNGNGTATLSGTTSVVGTFPLTFTAGNGRTTTQQTFTLSTAQLPAFTSSATATFALGLANTFTVRATGSPNPTITQSGTLPTGVTFTGGTGSATISGTPAAGTVGAFPITLTATSGAESATQNFTLTVRDGAVFTSADAVSFTVGVPASFAITTASQPSQPVTSVGRVGGQPPPGMTLVSNGNNATLSGTPTGSGTFAMDLVAATSNPARDGMQTLTVTVREAPSITSANSTTFNLNAPGSFVVTASGFPTPTLSFTGTLPPGVSFTAGTAGSATISGTPTGAPGAFPLTITASNGAGSNATQTFTLTVAGPPAFTSAAATTFVAGTAGSFQVTASGGPAPTIGLSGSLPAGVSFTNNGNGTATLAGTPGAGVGGTFPLTLTASNGIGSPAVQSFTLTVNRAPSFTSLSSTSFTVNTASSFTVTTSAVPTATLSLTAGSLPAGVNFTANGNGTATIAGTATSNGTFNVTLQASNGVGAPVTQAFSLTITSCVIVNLQPASGALTSGTIGTAYNQAISATGGSGHTFAVTAGGLPPGLSLSSGGALSGTPTTTGNNYNFTVTATATGGCQGSAAYSLQIASNANNESFNNGVGNTQYSVGAGTPGTPAVVVNGNVLSNDSGSGTLTAGPSSIASTNGGLVAMNANGTFLYTPAAGFAGASDTFTYTLTDGNGMTDTAVVTINMSGVVWYVNSAAGGGGTGRSHQPFNTITAAESPAQAGHVIYVHAGSPTGNITLRANQTLRGAGESFTLNGLTINAGATPTLSGTVTLASNVAVRALNVNAAGAPAITGSSLTGTASLTNVAVTSSNAALSLTGVTGTFSTSGGSVTATGSGTAVALSGGTAAVTIGSTVTSASGRAVSIQNRSGGSVTFNGAVTDGGGGVLLQNNAGSSVAFTGGLSITTDGVPGFTATGGGSVTATQNNGSIVNFINTSNATALNVANTLIGGAGLTFRSIRSAGGTATGIILDSTGTGGGDGGLTVTGNSTVNSGGQISAKRGPFGNPLPDGSLTLGNGIYLNNTRNATFNRMLLTDFDNSGIVGRNVNGFFMADSAIGGAGTATGQFEGPVVFGTTSATGLSGTATFRNTPISGGFEHNLALYGQSGTMALVIERTSATPNDCLIEANGANGGHAINVLLDGTATGALTISQCTMRSFNDAAINAVARSSSNLTVNATAIDIVNNGQGQRGVVVTNGENAQLTATVANSNFESLTGPAIQFGQVPLSASAASLMRVTISNNDIYSLVGTLTNSILGAMSSTPGQGARTRILLADTYTHHHGQQPGVLFHVPDVGATPAIDVTVTRTHLDMCQTNSTCQDPNSPTNGPTGLLVQNLRGGTMCGNISPNTFHWSPIELGTGGGIVLQRGGSATVSLERGTSTLGTSAATVLSVGNGPHDNGPAPGPFSLPGSSTSVIGTVGVVENGSCLLPSAP